ncbi:hypothetical protein [Streptomyces sp. NPDC051677]|uniref:hypothetical protein n=1 Tax=Streptomyces sp. NPDC051677 TaxID=3365669 RepID=UPI0037D1F6B6
MIKDLTKILPGAWEVRAKNGSYYELEAQAAFDVAGHFKAEVILRDSTTHFRKMIGYQESGNWGFGGDAPDGTFKLHLKVMTSTIGIPHWGMGWMVRFTEPTLHFRVSVVDEDELVVVGDQRLLVEVGNFHRLSSDIDPWTSRWSRLQAPHQYVGWAFPDPTRYLFDIFKRG